MPDNSRLNFVVLVCEVATISLLLLCSCEQASAQEAAQKLSLSYGEDFYIGFMKNLGFPSLRLTIATTSESADYVVESRNEVIQTGTVNNMLPVTVNISSDHQVTDSGFNNREKGLHVYTTNDASIYVIAESFVVPHNLGVFLAYPCLDFETEMYDYHVISTEVVSSALSQVLLVGCENDTIISILPSQSIILPNDLQSPDATSLSVNAGTETIGTLQEMQTLLIRSDVDLTGTRIRSNKPLTVISGHECGTVPSHLAGCEPFAVQVPPSLTWGNNFLLASFSGRDMNTKYKCLSKAATASLTVVCDSVTLDVHICDNEPFPVAPNTFCYVHSTEPILLVQLATSGSSDNRGDPAISLISAIDQYVTSVHFVAPPANIFTEVYISVTAAIEHFNSSNILFNDQVLNCDAWREIIDLSSAIIGYGCSYDITGALNSEAITQHKVSHLDSDGLLSVIVYGFNRYVGFAYLAGFGTNETVTSDNNGFLPFFNIINFTGVSELPRNMQDGHSGPIIIPNGLFIGEELVTTAFVNENGVISFNEPWGFSYPDNFPTSYHWIQQSKAIAPFWSDNDIRKEGTVRYVTYCNITGVAECSNLEQSQDLLDEVNHFLLANHDRTTGAFSPGYWMLIAQWDHVHPYPHGADDIQGIPEAKLSKTNTYQAVLISSLVRTTMMFTYLCGDMQWSTSPGTSAAVVGYNLAEGQYDNHWLSGYDAIGDLLSCGINSRRSSRKKRENQSCRTTTMSVEAIQGRCTMMYYSAAIVAHSFLMNLDPCPHTRQQADKDTGRFRRQNDLPECYVSMRPVIGRGLLGNENISLVRQCCYDKKLRALVNNKSIAAGSVLFQHPLRERNLYNKNYTMTTTDGEPPFGDRIFKEVCCNAHLNDSKFCNNYFERRPISTNHSKNYARPTVGHGYGDPHYATFDGVSYSFQQKGDFTLFLTHPNSSITVQGRLDIIDQGGATFHRGLAFGNSDAAFHIESGTGTNFKIYQTRPFQSQHMINPTTLHEFSGHDLVELRSINTHPEAFYQLTADFFQYGLSLTVSIFEHSSGKNYLSFVLKVPKSYQRMTRGFFGNFDDNKNVEFFPRNDEKHIEYPPGERPDMHLYEKFSRSWKLTSEDENLFADSFRRRKRQETNSAFSPILFEDLNFTDVQRLLCEDNPPCLFDLAVTQSNEVASITLNDEKEANKTMEIFGNFPPNITAERGKLSVNLGQETILTLLVTDTSDDFTFTVEDDLPGDLRLEEQSHGKFVFRWTIQEVTNDPLVFIANDSRGAASLFSPIVEICACVNGGQCTLDGVITSNSTIVMNCLCTQAWDGQFCEEDRNGCSEIECFERVECMDIPAPGVGAVCGSCPVGYNTTLGDAPKCYDIDECFLNETLCEQTCTNTDGGYFCSCTKGYQLVEGTGRCQDIDECFSLNDCHQQCQNTLGSYTCSCFDGFSLSLNNNCVANEPCDRNCSLGFCAVSTGVEMCYCPVGFQLDRPNGTQCIDEDECHNHNPCEQKCVNTEGSYRCSCVNGYRFDAADNHKCEDIDECFEAALESIDLCEDILNSRCVNSMGSYECMCVTEYNMTENRICQRVRFSPPEVNVLLSPTSILNSVNFTSQTLVPGTFTSAMKQKVRNLTAAAVNKYCQSTQCTIQWTNGSEQLTQPFAPENVALPSSLVQQDANRQLQFTLYVQTVNKKGVESFLSKEHLQRAIDRASELYRDCGLLLISIETTSPTTTISFIGTIGIVIGAAAFACIVMTMIVSAVACCRKHRKVLKCAQDRTNIPIALTTTGLKHDPVYDFPIALTTTGLKHDPVYDFPIALTTTGLKHDPVYDFPNALLVPNVKKPSSAEYEETAAFMCTPSKKSEYEETSALTFK